jgi:hypothetical protein
MKSIVAAFAITLSISAFAEGGTEAPALSGISPEAAAATEHAIAERRAERHAKCEAKEAAKHATKSAPAPTPSNG